jgi:hypothetical protein
MGSERLRPKAVPHRMEQAMKTVIKSRTHFIDAQTSECVAYSLNKNIRS